MERVEPAGAPRSGLLGPLGTARLPECVTSDIARPVSDEAQSPVFYAEPDDPEMQEAAKRAVSSFKYLWRELTWEYRRIIPALELSGIKAAFKDPDEDHVEHMWLSEIEFDGEVIRAKFLNSPNQLTSVREGDQITPAKISSRIGCTCRRAACTAASRSRSFALACHRANGAATIRHGVSNSGEPSRVDLVPNWQEKERRA